ncbi:MAG TPA: chemotaxis protein CheX [Acidimicrobiia bacterium]|nr:chemotaxis protein CheX [Acidimicrobiia bacterium]
MLDFEPELTEITERAWASLVEAPLLPRQPGQPGAIQSGSGAAARTFTGCVQITGAWEGAVTVHCSEELAKVLTAAMFMVDAQDTTPEEVTDALGELANMVGGNVKALLPEPCRISLPAVADGMDYRLSVPGARPVTAVTWTCNGEPLMVRLLERRTVDSSAGANGAAAGAEMAG